MDVFRHVGKSGGENYWKEEREGRHEDEDLRKILFREVHEEVEGYEAEKVDFNEESQWEGELAVCGCGRGCCCSRLKLSWRHRGLFLFLFLFLGTNSCVLFGGYIFAIVGRIRY